MIPYYTIEIDGDEDVLLVKSSDGSEHTYIKTYFKTFDKGLILAKLEDLKVAPIYEYKGYKVEYMNRAIGDLYSYIKKSSKLSDRCFGGNQSASISVNWIPEEKDYEENKE